MFPRLEPFDAWKIRFGDRPNGIIWLEMHGELALLWTPPLFLGGGWAEVVVVVSREEHICHLDFATEVPDLC